MKRGEQGRPIAFISHFAAALLSQPALTRIAKVKQQAALPHSQHFCFLLDSSYWHGPHHAEDSELEHPDQVFLGREEGFATHTPMLEHRNESIWAAVHSARSCSAVSPLLCRVSSGAPGRAHFVMSPSGMSSSRSWMPALHQRPCTGVGARSSPLPGGCATVLSSWPPLASWSLSTM